MADATIHGIDIEVSANAGSALAELRKLAQTLSRVNAAGRKLGLSKANKELKSLHSASAKTTSALSKVAAAFKRIVFYRAIRSAIKSLTDGFREGLKNAYQFSKINNGALAQSLDTVATKSLTMKNQLGAAFGGLLTALTPIILSIISLIIRLANALSMLFAALGGQGQFKKAKDVWTEWGDAAAGAGGAAKEALKYLAPFDELNVLPDDKTGGGGGGGGPNFDDMFDYEEIPEWLKNIQDFAESFKITFNDVIFDWSDLTGEQITEKIIAGLGGLLGAGVGFMIGGVPGAIVGTLIGVGLGIEFGALTFDHDGVISESELKTSMKAVLNAFTGGILGFVVGGPGGALVGASLGFGISLLTQEISLLPGTEKISKDDLLTGVTTAMTTVTGGVIGFLVGGPGGALIGAAIGFGISAVLESIDFTAAGSDDGKTAWERFWNDFLEVPQTIDWVKNAIDWVSQGISEFVDEVSILFTGKTFADWNSYADEWAEHASEVVNGFLNGIADGLNNAVQWVKEHVFDPLVNAIKSVFGIHSPASTMIPIGQNIAEGILSGIAAIWSNIKAWVNTNVWQPLVNAWNDLVGDGSPFHIDAEAEVNEITLGSDTHFSSSGSEFGGSHGSFTVEDGALVVPMNGAITKIQDKINASEKVISGIEAGLTKAQDSIPQAQKTVYTQARFNSVSSALTDSQKTVYTQARFNSVSSALTDSQTTIYTKARFNKVSSALTDSQRTVYTTSRFNAVSSALTANQKTIPTTSRFSSVSSALTDSQKTIYTQSRFNSVSSALTDSQKTIYTQSRFNSVSSALTDKQKTIGTSANFISSANGLKAEDTTFGSTALFNKYSVSKNVADGVNMQINATANITKTKGNVKGNLTLSAQALGGVLQNGVWSSIPQYASGTTRAHGSLFVAGEAGPEVVGHIGGRTEVLNRSQLAATMYASVRNAMRGIGFHMSTPSYSSESESDNEEMMYRAFSRALADSGLDGGIELDGEVIYRKMVSRNKQNTRLTGVNAMAV